MTSIVKQKFDYLTSILISGLPLLPAGWCMSLTFGGQRHNILATLDRRPREAYHDQVRAGPGKARSIIDSSQRRYL